MKGHIDAIKSTKLIHEEGEMSKGLVLMFDKMYLQKVLEYTGVNHMVVTKVVNFARISLVL